jgi:hypothetical protein
VEGQTAGSVPDEKSFYGVARRAYYEIASFLGPKRKFLVLALAFQNFFRSAELSTG